jgi:hypothetical protein
LWEAGHPNIVVLGDPEKAVDTLAAMEKSDTDFGIYFPSVDGDKMVVVASESVLREHEPLIIRLAHQSKPYDFNLPEFPEIKMADNGGMKRYTVGHRNKMPYKKRNGFF